MKKLLLIILLVSTIIDANGQILIPNRAGNLWGLADLDGNIKVKPFVKDISEAVQLANKNYFISLKTIMVYLL